MLVSRQEPALLTLTATSTYLPSCLSHLCRDGTGISLFSFFQGLGLSHSFGCCSSLLFAVLVRPCSVKTFPSTLFIFTFTEPAVNRHHAFTLSGCFSLGCERELRPGCCAVRWNQYRWFRFWLCLNCTNATPSLLGGPCSKPPV